MATIDIFNNNAFSMVEMTPAINRQPYRPQMLGQMGIFVPNPVRTTTVAIEERDGVLSIIKTSPRGAPLPQRATERRKIRDFRTVRIAKGDRITAGEIQNIRAFGSETEFMQVQAEVARRIGGEEGLRADVELTHENMRLGAIQGIVLDADGSTIINWYTEFGIAQPAEVNFALGVAETDVRGQCSKVVRAMARASKGAFVEGVTEVHALAGDEFYDALINHGQVRETFLHWQAAQDLRQGAAFGAFPYGGIMWHNYRGTDDEATVSVASTKAKFFPRNARGVFEVAYSPAETFDFVNTPGLPVYSMIVPDKDRNMYVDVEVYSYPLFICKRPEVLQRGTL